MYLIYGMYSCMNIAAMVEDIPQAVLLRSVIPADEESKQIMQRLRVEPMNRRRIQAGKPPYVMEGLEAAESIGMEKGGGELALPSFLKKHLADGPGKMCIAMDITGKDNDIDMVESSSFYVTEGRRVRPVEIKAGKRIGIDYAGEAADYLWRFYL